MFSVYLTGNFTTVIVDKTLENICCVHVIMLGNRHCAKQFMLYMILPHI